MRQTLCLAALLVAPMLAGCFGGSGGAGASDDRADAIPELPADLMMDGAEVIHRNETSVTFLWEGDVDAASSDAQGNTVPGHLLTSFDMPPGVQLEVDSWMEWPEGIDADFFIFDAASDGELVWSDCNSVGGLACWGRQHEHCQYHGNRASLGHKTCLYNLREPLAEAERWLLRVENYDPDAPLPFELTLRLETVAPYAVYALDRVEPLEVTTDDGVVLRGHVYLPTGDGPFATVLEYSPYWTTGWYGDTADQRSHDRGRPTVTFWLRAFLDAGFAVAMVSERGMGLSDGCYQYLNTRVGQDGAAVVEAIAAKPWSNGKVATTGWSLPGGNALRIAAQTPRALAAVVAVSPVTDPWYHNWGSHGAPTGPPSGGITFQEQWTGRATTFQPTVENLLHNSVRATCPEPLVHGISGESDQNGDKSDWWQARDVTDALASADPPMLVSIGLGWDLLRAADRLGPLLNDESIFIWGQWDHIYPTWYYEHDYEDLAVAFLDHHLGGGAKAYDSGVAYVQDDRRVWHALDHWPPAAPDHLLLSDGALAPPGSDAEASEHVFESMDASPTLRACSPYQVSFVSAPLADEVVLAGNVFLNMTLSSTLPDGNLVAHLYRTPNAGGCGDGDAVLVARAASDLYHRGYLDVGRDFPTDSPAEVRLMSDPFGHVVPGGNRLVLVISGGDHPFCGVPIEDPCGAAAEAVTGYPRECDSCLFPDADKPQITVHTGPGALSELALPVIEGALRLVGEESRGVEAAPLVVLS